MKKSYLFYSFLVIITMTFFNCKKEDNKPADDFTGEKGSFTDIRDNKTYAWVKINSQIWMAQNLNFGLTTGTWYYSSNSNLADTYGRLYTHEAALLAVPEGWHLPSVKELDDLSSFLGGIAVAGGKLKQTGTSNWLTPNTSADNSTGFNALPGGMYDPGDGFYEKGNSGYFWTSTNSNSSINMRYYYLNFNDAGLHYTDSTDPDVGLSVRCIKN